MLENFGARSHRMCRALNLSGYMLIICAFQLVYPPFPVNSPHAVVQSDILIWDGRVSPGEPGGRRERAEAAHNGGDQVDGKGAWSPSENCWEEYPSGGLFCPPFCLSSLTLLIHEPHPRNLWHGRPASSSPRGTSWHWPPSRWPTSSMVSRTLHGVSSLPRCCQKLTGLLNGWGCWWRYKREKRSLMKSRQWPQTPNPRRRREKKKERRRKRNMLQVKVVIGMITVWRCSSGVCACDMLHIRYAFISLSIFT